MPGFDVAAIVAEAMTWPLVAAVADGAAVELLADGRPFARIDAGGIELRLPPRLATMLVETGRAAPLPLRGRVDIGPEHAADGVIDLVRLAYERARVTGTFRARGREPSGGP